MNSEDERDQTLRSELLLEGLKSPFLWAYENRPQENAKNEVDPLEEVEPQMSEDSIALSYGEEVKQDLEESLPLLFDAERPESEEEVDEEAGLPTDSVEGWVVAGDVRCAGEAQYVRYDDAPSWDANGRNCTGSLSDGARVLRSYILATYPTIHGVGGYNCRPNSASSHKVSMHGIGRALDIMIPTVKNQANSAIGDPIANWLVRNASMIGIQYLIWNRVRWSGRRLKQKFARYTGPNPHQDHIHVELNLDGAQRKTPWFAARDVLPSVTAAKTIDYAKSTRLNRLYGKKLNWQNRLSDIARLLGLSGDTVEERTFVDAVARWQRQQGLADDGILGLKTWAKMEPALRAQSSKQST